MILHAFILSVISACLPTEYRSFALFKLLLRLSNCCFVVLYICYVDNYHINMTKIKISHVKQVYFLLLSIIHLSQIHIKGIHVNLRKN